MRRLLALVLCLLMPLQGFAAVQAVAAPCPMEAMMSMDMDAADMADAMDDCCNDLATFERTGQACKTGQECTAPAVWMPPFQPVQFKAEAAQDLTAPLWRNLPPGATTRLWRPPTSV